MLLGPTFPINKQEEFKGFKKQTTIKYIFRKLPSIQRVKIPELTNDEGALMARDRRVAGPKHNFIGHLKLVCINYVTCTPTI